MADEIDETTITYKGEPSRLDSALRELFPQLSRRRAAMLSSRKLVLLNGVPAQKSAVVNDGDRIALLAQVPPGEFRATPWSDSGVEVLYEDDHMVALAKPSGVPTVPLSPHESQTLAGAVRHLFPECADIGRKGGDSGLIQRLDTETSGLVVAAKTPEAFDALLGLQAQGSFTKTYVALSKTGEPPSGIIDSPLGPYGPGGKMVRPTPNGRPATTEFAPLLSRGGYSLIQATILSGYRHQIRVHMKAAGSPICGDKLYGGQGAPQLDRLFLHAHRADLPHPVAPGKVLNLICPFPRDLLETLSMIFGEGWREPSNLTT